MQHSPNVMQPLAESSPDRNADPDNWEWKAKSRAVWELASENWQHFCAKWYGATESQFASLVDPNSPYLSLAPLPPLIAPSTSSSIFVRKSYVTMFDLVWAQAISSWGRNGVIITGQTGTGRTLFHLYFLGRLLQQKQVVLFSPEGNKVYLFYYNKVFAVSMKTLANEGVDVSLPNPISSNVFIWSLFDIREQKEPERFLVTYPCFPVQTTSPDPLRYKIWDKELMPLHTGLPLWTRDELAQGLQYQLEYPFLMDALHKVYTGCSPDLIDPLFGFHGARALLEEQYSEEGPVPPSPEDDLDHLLDAAIVRFGYSARDVFHAVFNYVEMTRRHENAFDLKYAELRAAVSALSNSQSVSDLISDWILTLYPVDQGHLMSVRWNVDFKSDWVARSVIQKLGEAEDIVIRQQFRSFRRIPGAQVLAGRLLEPLAHRCIANATNGFWSLTNMKSNAADPPHFTLDQDSSVPDNVQFLKVKRKIVKLQSTAELPTCLENNSYYIPEDPDFPLFDAFTIEFDRAEKSAILWVIQVTTSRIYECSAMGYRRIREIIAILKDELRGEPPLKKGKRANGQASSMPLVQVRYLLVAPTDEPQFEILRWQFPKGWSQNRTKDDHSGNVYRLEVPLALCPTVTYHECF